MAWAVMTKCNVAIQTPTIIGWGKSWVLPLAAGNASLVVLGLCSLLQKGSLYLSKANPAAEGAGMEPWDTWTPLQRLRVWLSPFPSLLAAVCPGEQPGSALGAVQRGRAAVPVPLWVCSQPGLGSCGLAATKLRVHSPSPSASLVC